MEVTVKLRRLRTGSAPLPAYATSGAAGLDLYADLEREVTLAPMERAVLATGIALEIAPGFEGQVRPRSGRAIADGFTLLNAPGTIDSDYRGEIMVVGINLGSKPVTIRPGDRVAQLVIAPVARAKFVEVESLSATERGGHGFGHTGR
jgi:dUTP pyrophosphatase